MGHGVEKRKRNRLVRSPSPSMASTGASTSDLQPLEDGWWFIISTIIILYLKERMLNKAFLQGKGSNLDIAATATEITP